MGGVAETLSPHTKNRVTKERHSPIFSRAQPKYLILNISLAS